MDVNKLLKALDNEDNENVFNLTNKEINQTKIDVLKDLDLDKKEFTDFMNKLKQYRYIDEINDLKYGAFIRWIPLKDPDNIYLTIGGIICEIKVTDKGIHLICKNHAHKHFQIMFDENMIFQKLSGQEQVLLTALDHLI
jgi:hypothetical protein